MNGRPANPNAASTDEAISASDTISAKLKRALYLIKLTRFVCHCCDGEVLSEAVASMLCVRCEFPLIAEHEVLAGDRRWYLSKGATIAERGNYLIALSRFSCECCDQEAFAERAMVLFCHRCALPMFIENTQSAERRPC